jgi:hypothetical protein
VCRNIKVKAKVIFAHQQTKTPLNFSGLLKFNGVKRGTILKEKI